MNQAGAATYWLVALGVIMGVAFVGWLFENMGKGGRS